AACAFDTVSAGNAGNVEGAGVVCCILPPACPAAVARFTFCAEVPVCGAPTVRMANTPAARRERSKEARNVADRLAQQCRRRRKYWETSAGSLRLIVGRMRLALLLFASQARSFYQSPFP